MRRKKTESRGRTGLNFGLSGHRKERITLRKKSKGPEAGSQLASLGQEEGTVLVRHKDGSEQMNRLD